MADLPKRPVLAYSPRSAPRKPLAHEFILAAAANGGEGWIFHHDLARADRSNALQISANTRTQIIVDGLGPAAQDDLDTIPRDSATPLLSNGLVMPAQLNDNYLIRFGFTAAMVDPGLSQTEAQNSIKIEYDVGGAFTVHEARKLFMEDPGPVRRERNSMGALSAIALLTSALVSRLTLLDSQITAATTEQTSNGERFIEFGQAFAGNPVLTNGVGFYVTPTVDIELWAPDITITRLSSPTE